MKKIVLAAAAVPALAILAAAVPNTAQGDAFSNVRKAYSPISRLHRVLGGPPIPAAFLSRDITRIKARNAWLRAHYGGNRDKMLYMLLIGFRLDASPQEIVGSLPKKIAENGVNPNDRDMHGMTALHWAAATVKGRRAAQSAAYI